MKMEAELLIPGLPGLPYWISSDAIIFKPEFTGPLHDYIEIISQYSRLIFSDYDKLNILLKTNNKYYDKYLSNYKCSKFNEKINSLLNLTSLQELTFGCKFNQELENSLSNLTSLQELTFGHNFNQKLGNSLSNLMSLQRLTFDNRFNQELGNCLLDLTFITGLTLGYNFNQELEIPSGIRYLGLNCNNIHLISNLPNTITDLELGRNFNLELNDLPSSIKTIKFDYESDYNEELNNLPKSLEYLELNKTYDKKISTCYQNLRTLKCYKDYKYIDVFNNNVVNIIEINTC